jgi:hypothetical protein
MTPAKECMMELASRTIELSGAQFVIDSHTGAIASIHLDDPGTDFVTTHTGAGLVRIAVPLPNYQSHFLETGTHGTPEISTDGDELVLLHSSLRSEHGAFPIQVEIRLRPSDEGLVVSARVHNNWTDPLPQVIFPQLMNLEPVGDEENPRLQLGRYRMKPLEKLTMRPDDARWLDRPLHEYIPYADFRFNMKWLDFGDERSGLTLYSRNTRHTSQGLLVQRVDRADDHINLRWGHYPMLEPGETWESGDYVILPHAGDWYAGARAYQQFASTVYPYNAPQRIREAMAIRSMWAAPRNAPPNIPFSRLPEYAEDVADPELGIAEIVYWHWWYRNGYPIQVDERLGTESDFAAALQACEELGVPIVLFVSHHILRDTNETDRDWVHLNAGMQAVINNWTYGRDFLPVFLPPFSGTHAMVNGSALSPGWRETGLEAYEHFLGLGGKGICFDVGRAWDSPNHNPSIDGRPDEEGVKLNDFHRRARDLIYEVFPEGSYSAEHVSDVNVPVYDYTWEWYNAADINNAAPFRYVFPQFRLNANVNEHPRGALIAFMEGALINVMPGNMHSYLLRECPDLVSMLKLLNRLWQRFLPYFTEGQFRFREGLEVEGGDARLYTQGNAILVIAINPTDVDADVTVSVDPTVWGGAVQTGILTVTGIDGQAIEQTEGVRSAFRQTVQLEPDTLCVYEFRPKE